MPSVCGFLHLWKGGANRRKITAFFSWLVALAWTVWKNPQEGTVLHGIWWFWSPFSWASSQRNKHIISSFHKALFCRVLAAVPNRPHLSNQAPCFYWLALLFKVCFQGSCSLFKQYIFFLRVIYLHSSILSHLFIVNISLVFLVII